MSFTYGYDTAGRNTQVSRSDGKTVAYEWDATGNRTKVTWPDSWFVSYAYDPLNRMTDVKQSGTTLLARYSYDSLSRRTQLTFGNSTTATYAYAANDNLNSIVHRFKSSSVTFGYNHNRVGQRTRLNVSDDRFLWRPAANENLDYTANALNQYVRVGANALAYDLNGNLTGDGVNAYTYDTENRLVGAQTPVNTVAYAYDPQGRRKSKTVNGVTTAYLHDGEHEIAEYDGSGTLLRRYVYGARIDEPLVQVTRAGTRFYYRADGLGSIVAHEEHSSGFVQRFSYGPFGESATLAGHPFRYTARRADEETGLYYYRARMYSPALGRFLQTDPIGYQGGLNLYAYVENDPLNFIDPMGLARQGGMNDNGTVMSDATPDDLWIPGADYAQMALGLCAAGPPGCAVGAGITVGQVIAGGAAVVGAGAVLMSPTNRPGGGQGAGSAAPDTYGTPSGGPDDPFTKITDVTAKGARVPVQTINVSSQEFATQLEQSGFQRSVPQNTNVVQYSKGNVRYVIRPSESTGTKIDVFSSGRLVKQYVPAP